MPTDYLYAVYKEWAGQGLQVTENLDIRNADREIDKFIDREITDKDKKVGLQDLILYYGALIESYCFQEGFKAAMRLIRQASL